MNTKAANLVSITAEERSREVGSSVRGVNISMWGLAGIVVMYLWLEEILDIPHMVGFARTPVNWVECILETVVVCVAAAGVMLWSNRLLRRIQYLEGFHVMCSHCKRIRVEKDWITIEQYMQRHTSLRLSHSFCPECAKHLYNYEEGEDHAQGGAA